MSRRRPHHRQAQRLQRRGVPRGPVLEEQEDLPTGREIWESAMEGRADHPQTLASALCILGNLTQQLTEGIIAVQELKGTGLAVLEAWELCDDEEDLLALRGAILVQAERIRLLADSLGLDTTDWLS